MGRWAPHLREHRLFGKAAVRLWAFRDDVRGTASAHRGVEIAWLHSGEGSYHIGTKVHAVHAGDVIVVPAAVEHGSTFAAGTRCGAIEIGAEYLSHFAELHATQPIAGAFARLPLAPCATIARALEEEVTTTGPGQATAIEALVEVLSLRLLRQAPASAAKDPRIARAIELIHASYADELSIDDLAAAAAMSRFHFSRAFRAHTSTSPYAFLKRYRVERAAHLLRSGRSVTEAAFESGFRDLGRFAQAFRARFGTTPSAYAKEGLVA
jgi:AraC family transcriptional regulator